MACCQSAADADADADGADGADGALCDLTMVDGHQTVSECCATKRN